MLAAAYRTTRATDAPDPELESQLRRVLAQARETHRDLPLDDELFVAFLAERTPLDTTHVEDLYLACAVLHNVPGAAERLERLFVAQIPKAIARIDRSPTFITEIQQRVRAKLVIGDGRPRIGEYQARGSLAAFVRIAAIREALMDKRATARQRLDYEEPEAIATGDATLELVRREYRPEFQEALRTALATLERNERSALRMSFIDNLSIDEIGRLFRVHRATAARWILRAQERVRALTRAELQKRLRLTESEVNSLVADLMNTEALSSAMLASTIPAAS